MYESDDPRSRLSTASDGPAAAAGAPRAFGTSSYAHFYKTAPQEEGDHARTWYVRGQNFIIAYSKVEPGARFDRTGQVDEYILLMPDPKSAATVGARGESQAIQGYTITIVPPGDSSIEITGGGEIYRLFSTQSADLVAKVSNPEAYVGAHPQIPPFQPWPEPVGGFKIRSYSLDVPDTPGRFGKIWRSTTFMVNVFAPAEARDTKKLSPHEHADFEQCSLATGGSYVHHLRWPWTANQADWHEDEHEVCGSPSVAVIPPRVIHTSAGQDKTNWLVDIFAPPRKDFSLMDGWVLNADEYPMPQDS